MLFFDIEVREMNVTTLFETNPNAILLFGSLVFIGGVAFTLGWRRFMKKDDIVKK